MNPSRFKRYLISALAILLLLTRLAHAAEPIHFHTDQPGYVSLNLYRPDGSLARQILTGKHFASGDHEIAWDGLANDAPLPPGDYKWRAVIHDGLALRLRGWVGDWGGDLGVPTAAAADDSQVYLGWSLASANADTVVACDAGGRVRWTHHRGALSGCRALAVDAGEVFVLGGEGADAEGRTLYKLSAKDGAPVPWPDGRTNLRITSLWPPGKTGDPVHADYLAVKNGRIYLSFTAANFISILDAKTGAYMQTIVGEPSGAMDAVGTKSDTPTNPGVLVDADFLAIALNTGAIGKLLLVHDPLWVVASAITPLDSDENITAITMIGDGAKHHAQDIFVAIGAPYFHVQARSALDEGSSFSYYAGEPGGRPPGGAWQPNRMGDIRAIALNDTSGRLWVAEGDSVPKRISVWTTSAAQGRFFGEFFAPPTPGSPAAINPLDPRLMFAGGCEWRINPRTGRAACLGIVTREPPRAARFAVENGHVLLVLTPSIQSTSSIPSIPSIQSTSPATIPDLALKRVGPGDYRPYAGPIPAPTPAAFQLLPTPGGSWQLTTADGYALGSLFGPTGAKPRASFAPPSGNDWPHLPDAPGTPALTQMPDGKVFVTAGCNRIWNLELTGLDTLRPLASGKFTISSHAR